MVSQQAVSLPDVTRDRRHPGLRPPWQKGESGNPGGVKHRTEWHKVMALARENSMAAMAKLVQLIENEDARIAFMASQAVLERAWGKPKDADPNEAPPSRIDLRSLTPSQLEVLMSLARQRDGVIDGEAVDTDASTPASPTEG